MLRLLKAFFRIDDSQYRQITVKVAEAAAAGATLRADAVRSLHDGKKAKLTARPVQ